MRCLFIHTSHSERFPLLVGEGTGHPMDCSAAAVWAPSFWGSVGSLGMQTMGRGLQRAIAAQEVCVWAQAWLLVLHMVLFYVRKGAPFLMDGMGWDFAPACPSFGYTRSRAQGGFHAWSGPEMKAILTRCFESSAH